MCCDIITHTYLNDTRCSWQTHAAYKKESIFGSADCSSHIGHVVINLKKKTDTCVLSKLCHFLHLALTIASVNWSANSLLQI
jgi:hypothetical protein